MPLCVQNYVPFVFVKCRVWRASGRLVCVRKLLLGIDSEAICVMCVYMCVLLCSGRTVSVEVINVMKRKLIKGANITYHVVTQPPGIRVCPPVRYDHCESNRKYLGSLRRVPVKSRHYVPSSARGDTACVSRPLTSPVCRKQPTLALLQKLTMQQ